MYRMTPWRSAFRASTFRLNVSSTLSGPTSLKFSACSGTCTGSRTGDQTSYAHAYFEPLPPKEPDPISARKTFVDHHVGEVDARTGKPLTQLGGAAQEWDNGYGFYGSFDDVRLPSSRCHRESFYLTFFLPARCPSPVCEARKRHQGQGGGRNEDSVGRAVRRVTIGLQLF